MLQWQYKQILAQLEQVELHAGDPTCPCVMAAKGEYCLPKHLLLLESLAAETAAMVEGKDGEMFGDLQGEAEEKHKETKDRIVCHIGKGEPTDLVDWARNWRKKVEGIYYTCAPKAKAHVRQEYEMCGASLEQRGMTKAKLEDFHIRISGKCKGEPEQCRFTLKRQGEPVKVTGIETMAEKAVEMSAAKGIVQPFKVELAGKVFNFAPETMREMVRVGDATRAKEMGFYLCNKGGQLFSGPMCVGSKCHITYRNPCQSPNSNEGRFHTHPGDGHVIQETFSVKDLVGLSAGQINCITGNKTDKITCGSPKSGESIKGRYGPRAYPYIHPDENPTTKEFIRKARGYFYPNVGIHYDYAQIEKDAFRAAQDVKIAGKCQENICTFKVKAADEAVRETFSIKELGGAINQVRRQLQAGKAIAASPLTFAMGPTTLTKYELRHRLVEASDLIASHNPFTFEPNPGYPPELQPRMRGRSANRSQVQEIAKNLDADALLTDFHSIDRGSPIVGADNIVESGNGRVMALQHAIQEIPESYQRYRDELLKRVESFGLSRQDAESMKDPVLVRERITDMPRRTFVEDANTSATLTPSAIEVARSDALRINTDMLNALLVEENQGIEDALRSPKNTDFVSMFLTQIPAVERARISDAKGQLSQDGIRRIAMALFLRTFAGDSGIRLAEKFFEAADPEVRNVFNGLAASLGILARAEGLCRDGQRDADLAIGEDIAATVGVFADIKKTPGMTVVKYLDQSQMFERTLNTFQERLLKIIDERSRSGKKIGQLLRDYASLVIDSPPPAQVSFMPGGKVTKAELLEQAVRTSEQATMMQTTATEADTASWLMSKIDTCSMSVGEAERALSWKPLREFIVAAVGVVGEGNLQICLVGIVAGTYHMRIVGVPEDKQEILTKQSRKLPGSKEVHSLAKGERYWQVTLPDELVNPQRQDLHWGIQQIIDQRRGEPAEQAKMFQRDRTISFKPPNLIEIRFDYNAGLVSAVKSEVSGVRFQKYPPLWWIKLAIEVEKPLLKFADRWDFTVDEDLTKAFEALHVASEAKIISSEASVADVEVSGLGGTLLPFQKAGVAYASAARRTFIADEMGLGKTIQALATVQNLRAFPLLIVTPASLKLNWQREAQKWLPGKTICVLKGKTGEQCEGDVVILNYDILDKRAEELAITKWQSVIFDESHYLKNYKAKRTERAKELAKGIPNRFLLTGTPVLNRPQELLSQLGILGRLDQMGGFWEFAKRYCKAYKTRYGWDMSGVSNLEELATKLRACCFLRRTKAQVLPELPEKRRTYLTMEIDNRREYSKAESDLIVWLARRAADDLAFNKSLKDLPEEEKQRRRDERGQEAAHKAQRAEQLVKIEVAKHLAAQGKLAAVLEWIEDFLESGEKLVVFASHRDIVQSVAEKFSAASITGETPLEQRQKAIDDFQGNPDTKLLVLNIQAGGVGITLTAASNVAFLELGWNPATHDQAEDRTHRIGQKNAVTAWYFIAQNTIDERIAALIEAKRRVVAGVTGDEEGIVKELTSELLMTQRESVQVMAEEIKEEVAEGTGSGSIAIGGDEIMSRDAKLMPSRIPLIGEWGPQVRMFQQPTWCSGVRKAEKEIKSALRSLTTVKGKVERMETSLETPLAICGGQAEMFEAELLPICPVCLAGDKEGGNRMDAGEWLTKYGEPGNWELALEILSHIQSYGEATEFLQLSRPAQEARMAKMIKWFGGDLQETTDDAIEEAEKRVRRPVISHEDLEKIEKRDLSGRRSSGGWGAFVSGIFGARSASLRSISKPICTASQLEKLKRCAEDVKAKLPAHCGPEQWKKPQSQREKGCYNPFQVCSASIGCRPGKSK